MLLITLFSVNRYTASSVSFFSTDKLFQRDCNLHLRSKNFFCVYKPLRYNKAHLPLAYRLQSY